MNHRMLHCTGAVLAAAFCAGMLSACSPEDKPENAPKAGNEAAVQDLLSQIKARGTITIAMEGTWSPWTYHDKDGKLTGFDVALGQKIADKIGVKANFVEGKWDGLLAGLDAGRYDLMINGVGITKERAQAYSFSEPYAYDRVAVIVNGDRTDIRTMQDLRGKTTANTISSTYAETAERYGARVTGVDDLNQTFELLRAGNKLADCGTLSAVGAGKILGAFREFDRIIGCLEPDRVHETEIPAEVMAMAEARAAARKAKNFAESDRLRGEISRLGYVVEDVPGGAFRVKKA